MQCIIHSKVRQTTSILKLLNSKVKVDYNIESLLHDISKISLEEINSGHGILLNIDGYKCIVTCSHIIGKANMRIDISLEDQNKNICTESCKVILNIEEYEIAVLELINKKNEKKFTFHKIDHVNRSINTQSQHKITFLAFDGLLKTNLTVNEIDINNIYIENIPVKSILAPVIPIIVIESDYLPSDCNGLSGSVIIDETNKPIALISSTIGNIRKLNCIPLSIIIKFVMESKKHEMKSPAISTILFEGDIIESEYMGNQISCHRINNGFGLNYPGIGKKKINFKEGDVIQKINDISFNLDGTIYHEEIGLDLNIFAYFMIETMFGSNMKLCMFRQDENNEYKEQIVTVKGIPLESIYNIHTCNKNNYVIWKNCVFTELSTELITELIGEGLLQKNVYDYKVVKETNSKLTIIFDGKSIKLVDKIGNKKITSLRDIKNISNGDSKSTIACKNFSGENIKVVL